MWINRAKYEVEKLKMEYRIRYLEDLICPLSSHDYEKVEMQYGKYEWSISTVYKCKKCGKTLTRMGG